MLKDYYLFLLKYKVQDPVLRNFYFYGKRSRSCILPSDGNAADHWLFSGRHCRRRGEASHGLIALVHEPMWEINELYWHVQFWVVPGGSQLGFYFQAWAGFCLNLSCTETSSSWLMPQALSPVGIQINWNSRKPPISCLISAPWVKNLALYLPVAFLCLWYFRLVPLIYPWAFLVYALPRLILDFLTGEHQFHTFLSSLTVSLSLLQSHIYWPPQQRRLETWVIFRIFDNGQSQDIDQI